MAKFEHDADSAFPVENRHSTPPGISDTAPMPFNLDLTAKKNQNPEVRPLHYFFLPAFAQGMQVSYTNTFVWLRMRFVNAQAVGGHVIYDEGTDRRLPSAENCDDFRYPPQLLVEPTARA